MSTPSKPLEIGAAYIRVSTDDQTELSPDAQIRVILDAAKADGYLIPPEYIFEEKKGISGRKADNRPEFQRMIAIAKSQTPAPFSRLYLWKFSRFARNQEESTFYKGILRKKCGVEIKSVSEPIMEGMFGRLIETIIEWFDEYYSYNLSGEVIRGMTEKALRSGYQTTPSLGYDAVGNGQPFVINEEQYAIVEYIFQSYHHGTDMTKISRECNSRGWRTRRGNPFERRTILRILQNKFYNGIVEWNGYSFQGSHETRETVTAIFQDVQDRIAREYRPVSRREVSSCRHWLSGLLRCPICGASLAYSRASNPKQRSSYFRCWKALKGFHEGGRAIPQRKIENAVLASLKAAIDANLVEFEHVPQKDEQKASDLAIITEALARVDVKELRIREAYESGIDTLEEYKSNKERLRTERANLLEELERIRQLAAPQDDTPSQEEVLARIRNVYDLLSDPDVDYDVKGVAIRSVLREIIVDRAQNEIRFHYYA